MGQHDRDNTKDGYWPKPVPQGDVRDEPKDDSGKHSSARPDQDDKNQKNQDEK
ncbi:MAG: hypothetical protein ACRDTD_02595 [Pseudonocardiaceae bacterium]